ncbi:translocation/assembly module TamB domain-containing protein [Lentibacter sp. XHP0401]|uniref:translocation/assembly module TamB domain-containing protein n=1 Tax=Lentibacter sp. XHP0401 TaxID=2984334 RepID=UPI0021E8FEF9|nr:translocation/assembly module TamB domain-containing protein [Lentibacter sp. XHP0401]MCV2894676.1 translocation/assembly module TamB domain-containing protein [Lentibacter sp. XHP0401]
MQTVSASAQSEEADKGFVAEYLEGALSGLGRDVTITGFSGALSSRVTMEKLTISDDQGVWLTLTDAVLDWNRSSVLKGNIEINELSAALAELPRAPAPSQDTPSPEATTFSLPELPVSLRVSQISVKKVVLGAPVVGTPVTGSIKGSVSVAEGQGEAKLAITRQDGPMGVFNLEAGFSNTSRVLALDLTLREAANGIAANMLNLPGRPPVELSLKGEAEIDNFTADVVLKSDGEERLAGQIGTQARQEAEAQSDDANVPNRVIKADIAGDLTPLFAPEYRAFLGDNVALKSRISLFDDGRTSLDELTLTAAALRLSGEVALSADGLPESFQLDALLQDPSGGASLLPMSGPETRVQSAEITARFDSRVGDSWSLKSELLGLEREDVRLDTVRMAASGVIVRGDTRQVTARIDGNARGVTLADAALAAALGPSFTIGADLDWRDGQPLAVSNLELEATELVLTGAGTVEGLDSAMTLQGALQAKAPSISRFSALAAQQLDGAIIADLKGRFALLSGEGDLELNANATDLSVGIAQVDGLIAGNSQLKASVLRSTEGLTLRSFRINARGGVAEAQGRLATGQSKLDFNATLNEASQFVAGLNGPAQLQGTAAETASGWTVDLDAKGPRTIALAATISLPQNAAISAKLDANIGSINWIVPDLNGPASIVATARQTGEAWALDAAAKGPGGSTVNINGQIASNAKNAALALNGRVPLGLLNQRLQPNSLQGFADFDMKLNGPLVLSSVRGQVRTSGTRFSLPALRNALTDIDATVTLDGGNATVRSIATVTSGGQITAQGGFGLQAPYTANIELGVINAILSDPKLYSTRVNGTLTLGGALASSPSLAGRLLLDETEIRVPSTGIGAYGDIPEITHLSEPAAVRQTRSFAGLLNTGGSESAVAGGGIGLNVQIIAQNRIFVRGRGLDAELGGQLELTGTTADIIPKGRFDLIRGRLDILGKRLDLREGYARMQGSLTPELRLVAGTSTDDYVILVVLEGPADAPEITFTSEPELPSDEVLARLLFGRDISSISALQAVQLASAVATLAGKGGIGIVEKLRQQTGFDDLDVTTDEDGETSVRAGKYISDKAYTDIEIDSQGQSQINLNLDLSKSTKLRGSVDSDGETGIGLFFEKDY